MQKWAADLIAKLRMERITQRRLAEQMGITEEWLSSVLNGKRSCPAGFEGRCEAAINEILGIE